MATGRSTVELAVEPGQGGEWAFGPGLAADPAHWPPGNPVIDGSIAGDGLTGRITVPLRARGALLGVVAFSRRDRPEAFTADDLILAEELTAKAAVAVDNARRYSRERTTALTLQRSLLPQRLPSQEAIEVASRCLPAGTGADVGGDWFDVIPLSGARVALVVGDVVGHGLHASASMGRLRTAVRTLADVDLPPDELLTHLDDLVLHLSSDLQPAGQSEATGEFGATCLYSVYDPVSRRFTLASAGHPLPLIISPDGTRPPVRAQPGPPLGFGGLPFEATELKLAEGSLLALYTDGLVASRERDVDQGIAELQRVLDHRATSMEALCDRWTLGSGGGLVRHRTGRQRAGHQSHQIRRAADRAAADSRCFADPRGLRREQHRSAPPPGPHFRRGWPGPAARRPAHPGLGHPADHQRQDDLVRAGPPLRGVLRIMPGSQVSMMPFVGRCRHQPVGSPAMNEVSRSAMSRSSWAE